ncbi:MBL fold metallo-hydrolase [Limnoglobus roseus]|uniref:MBL fold metallo-hydrolase n=1 Tax=Limnoglobus roseus TaxID=2598579 RepID=A0A5C1AM56_9BACT|nr:MBL fold metallo-hydrolase [Limnoglobus roseus]QEL18812.1 MBL fold metallo-hydrolase [Limnoglobus roseus]
MASRSLIILGCGTSVGVPMLGCDCTVCRSDHPRNQRMRSSVLLKLPAGNLLIDTTPEMRLQLLREKIPLVHAVLYTHYHVDHVFGLDDVRIFPKYLGGPLPIYCTDDVEEVIRQAFSYAFHPGNDDLPPGVLPKLEFRRITREPFSVLGEHLTPIPLIHGRFDVFGYRIGNVAYCTDVSKIPDASWPLLDGLDVLILDCLKLGRPHPSHFNLDQALEAIARVRPRQAYLTHLSHEMDSANPPPLPPNVALAHDGLSFEF